MDHIRNPFSPGAGSPPPELVGRNDILQKSEVLLGRVLKKKSEKSLLLIGLLGVGKTVLLNEIERLTREAGYHTIFIEAHEDKSLPALLIPHLRRLMFDFDRMEGFSRKVKQGLGVLKSFVGGIKVKVGEIELGIDIEPERGTADSGDLEVDLAHLFIAVGEAAQERKTAVALVIDEIQYLSEQELSAMIMAMHKMQQRQLPVILIGAGLPILTRLAGESKFYAERLFEFPEIGPLSEIDAGRALQDPVMRENVKFSKDAIQEIVHLTQGYPYFIQEWGYQSWNHAGKSPITLEDVKNSTPAVIKRLDANFFKVRFDRLTPKEKEYLCVMATAGGGVHKSGDIAEKLGVKVNSLGPIRANLINKGMIYSPTYGDVAFTVPLFDEFMRRAMPKK